MILFEITNKEDHQVYLDLQISNASRQIGFLRAIVPAALDIQKPFLSQSVIKALNYHAIACLHTHAGEYRPCPVSVGKYQPPAHFKMQALMDDFVNTVNRMWETADAILLAAYVLWRINYIHPFINGNGRTARAACYFVLCVKLGQLLPGTKILPELLERDRSDYISAIQAVDASLKTGSLDLSRLHQLLSRLLREQMGEINASQDT